MTDIGVLLRTYLEPFKWLGLGSGGAIPLWNASRLVESCRRVRAELEGDFSRAERLFRLFSSSASISLGAMPAKARIHYLSRRHAPRKRASIIFSDVMPEKAGFDHLPRRHA